MKARDRLMRVIFLLKGKIKYIKKQQKEKGKLRSLQSKDGKVYGHSLHACPWYCLCYLTYSNQT